MTNSSKRGKMKCRGCGKTTKTRYVIADDLENPKPYHKHCVEELMTEVRIKEALSEHKDHKTNGDKCWCNPKTIKVSPKKKPKGGEKETVFRQRAYYNSAFRQLATEIYGELHRLSAPALLPEDASALARAILRKYKVEKRI